MTVKTGTTRPLSPNQQRVLDYIAQAGRPVSREDVLIHIGLPIGSVDHAIGRLKLRDRIITVGTAQQIGWTAASPRSAMYALPGAAVYVPLPVSPPRAKAERYGGQKGGVYLREWKPLVASPERDWRDRMDLCVKAR